MNTSPNTLQREQEIEFKLMRCPLLERTCKQKAKWATQKERRLRQRHNSLQ
jgi:hypothetical protein